MLEEIDLIKILKDAKTKFKIEEQSFQFKIEEQSFQKEYRVFVSPPKPIVHPNSNIELLNDFTNSILQKIPQFEITRRWKTEEYEGLDLFTFQYGNIMEKNIIKKDNLTQIDNRKVQMFFYPSLAVSKFAQKTKNLYNIMVGDLEKEFPELYPEQKAEVYFFKSSVS